MKKKAREETVSFKHYLRELEKRSLKVEAVQGRNKKIRNGMALN